MLRANTVARTWNPSTLGGRDRRITWGREFKTSLANMVKCHLYYKNYWLSVVAHTCISSYLGGWGRRITWTQEVEVTVSQDCATAFQPGQQSKTQFQKRKKQRRKPSSRDMRVSGRKSKFIWRASKQRTQWTIILKYHLRSNFYFFILRAEGREEHCD